MPCPITHRMPGWRMPAGIRWRTKRSLPTRIVWPALWPPLKRATTCTLSVSRSTTLPFPSSPHWAPAMTMFGMRGSSAKTGPAILTARARRHKRRADVIVLSPAPPMASDARSAPLVIDGNRLTLDDLESVARGPRRVVLDPAARERVARARLVVDAAVERGAVVYGVTTGFGNFADVVIPPDRLRELQANLVRSHSAGVGELLGDAETRGLMLLRANVLAKGFSGVRVETLELLLAMLNAGVHPDVPSQGSVGASGDLAPLAHLALAMIGEGTCRRGAASVPARDALAAAGLSPV